jgi:hypothetical protein
VVSGPFTLRKGDQADAEAIVAQNTTGQGEFELTVTSKDGRKSTATTRVSAIAPQVTLTGSAVVTGTQAPVYAATANFDQATYAWTLTDTAGTEVATGNNASWSLPADVKSGSYTLAVKAYSTKGQRTATAKQAVKVDRAVAAK